MHAKVGRIAGAEGEALFFADVPDAASDRMVVAAPAEPRSVYGEGRRPNWPAVILIAALHVVLLIALVKFDVLVIKKKPVSLKVFDVAEMAPPPAEEVATPKHEPVEIVPQLLTPPPVVQIDSPTPTPISVVPSPPKPVPVPAPPSGPVVSGNLEEKMIEGNPPRYPVESRRKKEQGTVQLRLLIGTDGHVAQVSIAQSSGFERLDQAALQAARTWRWQPMMRDGEPVEVRGIMSIPFVLS